MVRHNVPFMEARRIFSRGGQIHRRSQDFLWRALFFLKKLTTFLDVALKTQAKTAKWTIPTLQISPVPTQQNEVLTKNCENNA